MSLIIVLLFFVMVALVLFACYLAYYSLFFIVPMFFGGAIFASSTPEIVKDIIFLADIQPGQKALDLGSGDGRLVIAMARAGAIAHGYEVNPFLVLFSRANIKKAGLSGKAFVHWKNFWGADLSGFDVISVYQISYVMGGIGKKLEKELKPGAKIISNYFIFPGWPPAKRERNVYCYIKSS